MAGVLVLVIHSVAGRSVTDAVGSSGVHGDDGVTLDEGVMLDVGYPYPDSFSAMVFRAIRILTPVVPCVGLIQSITKKRALRPVIHLPRLISIFWENTN